MEALKAPLACSRCKEPIPGEDDFERSMNYMTHACGRSIHKQDGNGKFYCGISRKKEDGKWRVGAYRWSMVSCPACLAFKDNSAKLREHHKKQEEARKKNAIGSIFAKSHQPFFVCCSVCHFREEITKLAPLTIPDGWGVFTMLFKVMGTHREHLIGTNVHRISGSQGMGQKIKNHYLCPACLKRKDIQAQTGITRALKDLKREGEDEEQALAQQL